MNYEALGTYVRFPSMDVHATVRADKTAGGGRFEVNGRGMMVLALRSTENPDEMDVRIHDFRVDFKPASLRIPNLGAVKIPRITISKCDLDLENTRGTWYRSTRQIKLQVAVRLDPDHFPVMKQIGFWDPVTIMLTEAGEADWRNGWRLMTHAQPFKLPPPLDFLTVSPGQSAGCTLEAELKVSAECNLEEFPRATEVWICPGEAACLAWNVSGGPTLVTLTPVGPVIPIDQLLVRPTATTTYRLVAKNDTCEVSEQVTVRVVRSGETVFNLTANWNPWVACNWQFELPAALVGRNVRAVEIRHIKCDGGDSTWPEWGFIHTDPDGNIFSGNVAADDWRDITDQPLAGSWKFSPIDYGTCTPPPGTNSFEPACFEIRLGCL